MTHQVVADDAGTEHGVIVAGGIGEMWAFVEKPMEEPPAKPKARAKTTLRRTTHAVVPHHMADRLENLFSERKAPAKQQLGLMHGEFIWRDITMHWMLISELQVDQAYATWPRLDNQVMSSSNRH